MKKLVAQFRKKDDKLDADVYAAVERVLRGCEPGWSRSELNLLTQAIDTVGFPALRSARCASKLQRIFVRLGGGARSCDAVETATRAVMTAREFIAERFGSWRSWFELTKSCRYEASRQCAEPEVLMSLSRDAFRTLDKVCARNLELLAEATSAQASEDEDAEACSTLATDNSADESEDEASDDEPLLVQVSKALFDRMGNVETLAIEGRRKEWKQINDALLQAAHNSSGDRMLDDLKQLLLRPSADTEELMRLMATQNKDNGRLLATLFQHFKEVFAY